MHHMAVAVEHISKSYRASITVVLLAPAKPSVDDLLVLGGEERKTIKGRAGLRNPRPRGSAPAADRRAAAD
ncbi:hypothetical protein ACFC0R_39675 [Streptomyces sp. NPDC056086]|uniref:hypothetical protein n=1 Tax=Streptomyces sp. NPDC056086 TaxID=3345709 RepID=UPI0035D8548D